PPFTLHLFVSSTFSDMVTSTSENYTLSLHDALPILMPGGQKEAYDLVEPILKKIAAKAEDGEACVTYVGPNGAGHYVSYTGFTIDRKSTRLNSSHVSISYAVFCLKKKTNKKERKWYL